MHNIRLQLAFEDLHLRVLYRLWEIDNSLALPIKNPEEPFFFSFFFSSLLSPSLLLYSLLFSSLFFLLFSILFDFISGLRRSLFGAAAYFNLSHFRGRQVSLNRRDSKKSFPIAWSRLRKAIIITGGKI